MPRINGLRRFSSVRYSWKHFQKHTVRSRPQKAGRMSQGAADRCRDLRYLVEAQREVRLRDPVDVTDFGAWQAPRSEGPSLPIEPCDGNLSSARRSVGVCRSILWSGNRTWETPKS